MFLKKFLFFLKSFEHSNTGCAGICGHLAGSPFSYRATSTSKAGRVWVSDKGLGSGLLFHDCANIFLLTFRKSLRKSGVNCLKYSNLNAHYLKLFPHLHSIFFSAVPTRKTEAQDIIPNGAAGDPGWVGREQHSNVFFSFFALIQHQTAKKMKFLHTLNRFWPSQLGSRTGAGKPRQQ